MKEMTRTLSSATSIAYLLPILLCGYSSAFASTFLTYIHLSTNKQRTHKKRQIPIQLLDTKPQTNVCGFAPLNRGRQFIALTAKLPKRFPQPENAEKHRARFTIRLIYNHSKKMIGKNIQIHIQLFTAMNIITVAVAAVDIAVASRWLASVIRTTRSINTTVAQRRQS